MAERHAYEANVRIRFSHRGDLDEADEALRSVEKFIASRLSGLYWGEVTVEVEAVRMADVQGHWRGQVWIAPRMRGPER